MLGRRHYDKRPERLREKSRNGLGEKKNLADKLNNRLDTAE